MSSRSCPSKVTQELLGPTLLPHSSRVMDPFSPGTLCSVGSWALCTLCPGERFWAREACTSLTILSSSAMGGGVASASPSPPQQQPQWSHRLHPRLPGWPGLTQLPSHGAPGDSCPPPPASSTGRLPRPLGVAASRAAEQTRRAAGSCPQAELRWFPHPAPHLRPPGRAPRCPSGTRSGSGARA